MFALAGRPGEAERWVAAAESSTAVGPLDDGNTAEATRAYLRAILCRDGVDDDAPRRGGRARGLDPGSPYRATMIHTEGVSYLLEGDLDTADARLAYAIAADGRRGQRRRSCPSSSPSAGSSPSTGTTGTTPRPSRSEAGALLASGDFDDYWTSALVYAWLARVAVHRGEIELARDHVARAARLRHLLTYAVPVVSALALLEMAHAYIVLGDTSGGRTVLRQLRDIVQQRPKLGVLPEQADELRATSSTDAAGAPGVSSLTTAELRLVPYLSTHLSFREIGERLYISRHTVKSQAVSVYRKLGVSSRSEAITRMHELGVLANA